MADNPFAIIGGILVVFIIVMIFIPIIQGLFGLLSEDKCKPIVDKLNNCELNKITLNNNIIQISSQLKNCQSDYNKLITENITKKDFEEIKNDYNIIQYQITNLNQKFENIENSQISIYKTIINNFKLSVVLNIAFGIELLSIIFFKQELLLALIRKFKKKNDN
ncbi:hypothetical protein GW835_01680 [archaeon]|nr:hypothetical protein [archaeon]NCP79259.1 hypothetical protein [archaeon]NCP97793.1 hypothetical protein [archaeon]NCQ07026.1 hypothetical protein [archaeon]NCQ50822.1 hypothetical protein [archaeon]